MENNDNWTQSDWFKQWENEVKERQATQPSVKVGYWYWDNIEKTWKYVSPQ